MLPLSTSSTPWTSEEESKRPTHTEGSTGCAQGKELELCCGKKVSIRTRAPALLFLFIFGVWSWVSLCLPTPHGTTIEPANTNTKPRPIPEILPPIPEIAKTDTQTTMLNFKSSSFSSESSPPFTPFPPKQTKPAPSLECPVCDLFFNLGEQVPAELPCGHSFCLSHVSSLSRRCPTSGCGRTFHPPLSPNISLGSLAKEFTSIMSLPSCSIAVTPERPSRASLVSASSAISPAGSASSSLPPPPSSSKKKGGGKGAAAAIAADGEFDLLCGVCASPFSAGCTCGAALETQPPALLGPPKKKSVTKKGSLNRCAKCSER